MPVSLEQGPLCQEDRKVQQQRETRGLVPDATALWPLSVQCDGASCTGQSEDLLLFSLLGRGCKAHLLPGAHAAVLNNKQFL